ncbi:hypothetical protein [Flavobacterium sp. HJSW_4]|uniref:hypothetical protein n=1 Tax=Flavobacterium sp. HJSW_4 TaxID=3344660 RepID=UPI0035F4BA70
MRDNIEEILPEHNLQLTNSPNIYIVDYKNINGEGIVMHETKPDPKYVLLENLTPIGIYFDGFEDNALPLEEPGVCNSQCECVLFPEECNQNDWILFIEMKYANDREAAFRENRDYPNCMINQILETVKYFRDKKIIPEEKRVNAIVSFPNLIEEFSSTFFTGRMSMDDILYDHKILIRATNSGTIKSPKRIYI